MVGKADLAYYGWILALVNPLLVLGCDDGATFRPRNLNFVAQLPVPTAGHANGIVAADLDGDGDIDLAIPGFDSGDVWIHEQAGGALRPGVPIPVGAPVLSIDAADFNEDGRRDLALSLSSTEEVLVLDGRAPHRELARLPLAAFDVRAGDLDGDHHADLVVSRFEPGAIWTLRGDGHGGFREPRLVEAPSGPGNLTIADLDGDGRADVAAACATADRLAIFRGVGDGGLVPLREIATGMWPTCVIAADLDGRPPLELIGATNLGDTLVVAGQPPVETAAGRGPIFVAAADLDGDGRQEIAVTNKWENTVSIYRAGDAGLELALTLPAGDGPTPIAIADLDGDGRLDLAVVNAFANQLVLYLAR